MLEKPLENEFTLLHTPDSTIYTLSYNGFYEDHRSLFHIMDLQDSCLTTYPGSSLKLCTLFYNTKITSNIMDHYIAQLNRHMDKLNRLAIVGVPLNERALFLLKLKKDLSKDANFRFFQSAAEAFNFLKNE